MFGLCIFCASLSFSTIGLSPYKSLPQGHPRQPPFPSTPASNLEDIGRGGNKQEVAKLTCMGDGTVFHRLKVPARSYAEERTKE